MTETKVSFTNLTKEDIIKRTEALLPLIKERAISTDKNRKPDDEVIQKLGEAGIFAACVPKRFGGAELNIDTIAAVGRLIAQHSMSTAWVSCFYMGHNVMLCKWPEKAQETVFADKPYTQTPTGSGMCMAKPVDGGHRVSGRISWGTGIMHADWVVASAMPEGGTPLDIFSMVIPASEVKIHDTWNMAAMSGTGTNDYELADVFVPSHMTLPAFQFLNGVSEGSQIHGNPMYNQPLLSVIYGEILGLQVGGLEGLYNFYTNMIKEKVIAFSGHKVVEKPIAHMNLGTAYANMRTATDLLAIFFKDLLAGQGAPLTLEERISNKARAAYLIKHCRDSARDIFAHCGAGSLAVNSPAQRQFKDLTMLSMHAFMDWDTCRETQGRQMLGLEPNEPLV